MATACPNCGARVRVPSNHDADLPLHCLACESEFMIEAETDETPVTEVRGRNTRGRAADEETGWSTTTKIIAGVGGAGIALAIGLAVILLTQEPRKEETKKAKVDPDAPQGGDPNRPPLPAGFGPDGLRIMPDDVKTLFEPKVERKTPTRFIPHLTLAKDSEFEMPSLAAATRKPGAQPPQPGGAKLTLDEIKKALVYLKVEGFRGSGGSGFVIRVDGDEALIVTNEHVIDTALPDPENESPFPPDRVKAYFDSGLPTEQVIEAVVLGADAKTDLALLRVKGAPKGIKPIDPRQAVKPTETMPLLLCGFPFGEDLSVGTRGPNVTIGKGSVTSVRLDDAGELARVQVEGSLNPGNSGGPVLDADGRLVGVAVSIYRGSGIGVAIPAEKVIALLDGRILAPSFSGVSVDDTTARIQAKASVTDAFKKVKSVSLLVAPADTKLPVKGADHLWPRLEGAKSVELKESPEGGVSGEFELPRGDKGIVAQFACTYLGGVTVLSRPMVYQLSIDGVQTDNDSVDASTLARNPGQYAGQTIAVRGSVRIAGSQKYARIYELTVDEAEERAGAPPQVTFLAHREIRTLLDETPRVLIDSVPVRMTCLVGKRGADGSTPVRVAAIDIVGRGGRILKSLPYQPDDTMSKVNLNPENYIGQTVVVEGTVTPRLSGVMVGEAELTVGLKSRRPTLNLQFVSQARIATQLGDKIPLPIPMPARITGRVEDRTMGGAGPRVVTVTKVELIDEDDGRVISTFE